LPKAYEHEYQKTEFNSALVIDSLAYKNNKCQKHKDSLNNTLSQIYSRNKVRDIFQLYSLDNNVTYDSVIMCRFDINTKIHLKLSEVDLSYIYACNTYCPRVIIPDSILLMPHDVFIKWFNMYNDLSKIINNLELNDKVNSYNEPMFINHESLIFANYIYLYKNMDKVKFTDKVTIGV
jgi:hypothetical protein